MKGYLCVNHYYVFSGAKRAILFVDNTEFLYCILKYYSYSATAASHIL